MLAPVHRGAPRRLFSRKIRHLAPIFSHPYSSHIRRFAHSSATAQIQDDDQDPGDFGSRARTKRYEYGRMQNRKSGKSFKRKTASLPVTSMGKGAKVLIIESTEDEILEDQIQDHGLNRSEVSGELESSTHQHETSSNVLEEPSIDGDGLENALTSIESMRPTDSRNDEITILPHQTISELTQQLHKQFSVAQLREYVKRNRTPQMSNEKAKSLLEQPLAKPWHYDRTTLVADAGHKVKTTHQTQKAKAISNILERVWGVKGEPGNDQSCCAFRSMHEQVYKLVTAGSSSVLDELNTMFNISHKFIRRREFPAEYKVTLTGSERSLVLATNHLQQLLDQSKGTEQRIFLTGLQRPSIFWPDRAMLDHITVTESDLKQISLQTGAVLDMVAVDDSSFVSIQGIEPERILAAKQALLPLTLHRRLMNTVSMCASNSDKAIDLVKSPASVLQRLPSPYDRFSQRRITGVKSVDHIFDANEHVAWVTKEALPALDANFSTHHEVNTGWKTSSALASDMSASFGFHLLCGPIDESITSMVKEKGKISSVKTNPLKSHFWTTVPNAHLFFRKVNNEESKIKRTVKVKIQLSPDLTVKNGVSNNAPDFFITYSLNKHTAGEAKLQQVAATLDSRSHTIMLPNASMDVQFHNKSRVEWNFRDDSSNNNTALSQFCQDAGRRLEAGLSIRHLPGPIIHLPVSFFKPDQKAMSVPYMIAEVDQRETVSFKLTDERTTAKSNILPWYSASYAHVTTGDPTYTNSVMSLRVPSSDQLEGVMDQESYEKKLPLIRQEFVATTLWLLSRLELVQKTADYKSQPKKDDLGIN